MKLVTRPATSDVRPPAPARGAPASRIGSTGSTHGESEVIRPARNATTRRAAIRVRDYASRRTSSAVRLDGLGRRLGLGPRPAPRRRRSRARGGAPAPPAPRLRRRGLARFRRQPRRSGAAPFTASAGAAPFACASAPPFFFRRRRRRLLGAAFGAGRFSASAAATSGSGAICSRAASMSCVRARRVALGRGEQRHADRERLLERRLDEPRRVLLVPVPARVRERAEQPLRLRELRRSRAGPAPCATRGRAATSSARGSARARSACPRAIARRSVRMPGSRSFSHGGACVTSVTRSSKSARSTPHRDAVGERHHPQPPVRVLGRAGREELLERRLARAAVDQLLDERGALVEADLPAGDRRPRTAARRSSRNFGSTRCHSRWMTASRRRTSGVTGTSHGAGESFRRARRWWRRRGAGVTRAPSR